MYALAALIVSCSLPSGGSGSGRRMPGSDRHHELRFGAFHLLPFGDILVPSIAADELFITMQQTGTWDEFVHIGSCDHHRMDKVIAIINACMGIQANYH